MKLVKSIKVCEYSRSRSFHDDFILQDQASGERSQDQWSSGCLNTCSMCRSHLFYRMVEELNKLKEGKGVR